MQGFLVALANALVVDCGQVLKLAFQFRGVVVGVVALHQLGTRGVVHLLFIVFF